MLGVAIQQHDIRYIQCWYVSWGASWWGMPNSFSSMALSRAFWPLSRSLSWTCYLVYPQGFWSRTSCKVNSFTEVETKFLGKKRFDILLKGLCLTHSLCGFGSLWLFVLTLDISFHLGNQRVQSLTQSLLPRCRGDFTTSSCLGASLRPFTASKLQSAWTGLL